MLQCLDGALGCTPWTAPDLADNGNMVPALPLNELQNRQAQGGTKDPWLKIGALKAFLDGAMGSRTAAMLEPYSDDPSTSGILTNDPEKLTTLKVYAEEEPPKGTLYHYPNPYNHQKLNIAAWPAPPKIGQQIYAQATLTKMCLRYFQGESMEQTLAWTEGECEGFMRS